MNRKVGTLAGTCVFLILLLACGQINPATTVTAEPVFSPTHTPTPIPDIILLGVPGGDPYTQGEIEMHTADFLAGGEDCVSLFPFTINWETDPPTIMGEGSIDCHFQSSETPTSHAVMKYAVTLQGKFATGDLGETRLLIDLTVDGSLSQYVTGAPEGAINPMPESDPVVIKENGPYPTLNFEYLDGAKVLMLLGKGERTFFLHLK